MQSTDSPDGGPSDGPEGAEASQDQLGQPLSSLATKIILFVFASTFATALVVSWISIQSTHAYLSRMLDRSYPAALDHASDRLHRWLDAGKERLTSLSREDSLEALLERKRGARTRARDRERAQGALDRALRESEHFEGLAIVAPDGSVRVARGSAHGLPPELLVSLASPEATVRSFDPPPLRADAPADSSAQPARGMIAASAPLGSGSIVGLFSPGFLLEQLAARKPDASCTMLLVDAQGRVILASAAGPALPTEVPLGALATAPTGAKRAIREYTNALGQHVVGSTLPLGLFGWHVALEAPFDIAFEPMLSVVSRIFAIDLCVILLFSYLAYRITRAVVKPIEILSEGARRIAGGQFDLEIPEPATHDEVGLLTRTFNDMMRRIRDYQIDIETANRTLRERNTELQQAKETFEQLSITDGLTKLHNHRFFQDHLTREIKRVNRANQPLSMLLVDLDDFKSLNDRLGHAAGDELLARLAQIMNDAVRDSDLLARYGGEEFVVLASDTDLGGAYQLAEKVRTMIAEQSVILGDSMRPTRATVSIGVAQYAGNRKRFFQTADQALYRAKAAGKNCVVVADEIEEELQAG